MVPAPIDPFATPLMANSDPLRRSLYIKLNISCMLQEDKVLFESLIDDKYKSINFNDIFALSSSTTLQNTNTKQHNITFKYLSENYKEFVDFMLISKKISRDVVEKRVEQEVEFVSQELHEFIESERILYLQYFQEAILEKYFKQTIRKFES